jgi:hypothetical protein
MDISTHFPPKDSVGMQNIEPMLFLAGPIQGAPDWQSEAIRILERGSNSAELGRLHIANPRREYVDGTFSYPEQVAWEKRHILRAAKYGAVMFWFAKQDPAIEYEEGRAYAQTSRVEFGRVCGWKDYAINLKMIIGIEPGYNGSERYFRTCAEEHNLPVYEDLISTTNATLELIIRR